MHRSHGYTPFVLISHLRSGTHMLRTAIDGHPQVHFQAEPFNSNAKDLPYGFDVSSRDILERWVYRDFPPHIRAAGFVLHSYHPLSLAAFPDLRANPNWTNVWSELADWPGLHVVFLRRENLLRRFLSQLVAERRDYWHSWDGGRVDAIQHLSRRPDDRYIDTAPPPVGPIRIDVDRLLTDMQEIEALYAAAEQRLGHLPRLTIGYERMCEAPEQTFERVLQFLGLTPHPLRPALRKLEQRTLGDAIENYDELARRLRGTKWEAML